MTIQNHPSGHAGSVYLEEIHGSMLNLDFPPVPRPPLSLLNVEQIDLNFPAAASCPRAKKQAT